MFGVTQQVEELVGNLFVVFSMFFWGLRRWRFLLCETVIFEPLLGLGWATGFVGLFGASWQFFSLF